MLLVNCNDFVVVCLCLVSLILFRLCSYPKWMLHARCSMKCLNGMWLLNMHLFVGYSLNRFDYEVIDVYLIIEEGYDHMTP